VNPSYAWDGILGPRAEFHREVAADGVGFWRRRNAFIFRPLRATGSMQIES
jgi:hypothetical protein